MNQRSALQAIFSDEERRTLDKLSSERQVKHPIGEDIISERQHSPDCHVVVSGLVCRYVILPNGSRQIMAFLVPGDLCDAEILILKEMDHGVAALTPTTTALVPANTMKRMLRGGGCLGEPLWWGTMVDLATLRQRIVDHGRRDAREKLAHLIYEMLPHGRPDDRRRLRPADHSGRPRRGLRHDTRPRQSHLEEAPRWKGTTVTVLDAERLKALAAFNDLHLARGHDKRDHAGSRVSDLL